jgi:hypothetical protein
VIVLVILVLGRSAKSLARWGAVFAHLKDGLQGLKKKKQRAKNQRIRLMKKILENE